MGSSSKDTSSSTSSPYAAAAAAPPIEIVLTLDIGSSSIRCSAYEINHTNCTTTLFENCFACTKLASIEPTTGKIRLTTTRGTNLLDEIDSVLDECLVKLRQSTQPTKVVGLGFSSFCMNLIALNEHGEPVGKQATLSYACNTAAVAEEVRYIKNHIGIDREKEIYQRTGTPLHSSYALAQLRALYSKPEYAYICNQIVIWQTLSATCLTRWRGTPFSHVSFSEASWTGLFNLRTCEWDQEMVQLLPEACQKHMPPLSDFWDMPSGGMRPDLQVVCEHSDDDDEVDVDRVEQNMQTTKRNPYWDRWPELQTAQLYSGLGDGACATIGSHCTTPQKFSITIGTSAAVRVLLPLRTGVSFMVPEGLFCYRIDRSHVLVGGALTDGGSIMEWTRELLRLQDDAEFEVCMRQVEALLHQDYEACTQGNFDGSGVSVVPFLNGERSTGFRDGATFGIMGLTRNSSPAHFVKACLEGVVLRLEAIVRLLRHAGVEGPSRQQPRILVSGSAMEQNALWRQMLADCCGLQVQLDTSATELTSAGVATMVEVGLRMQRDMTNDSTKYIANDTNASSTGDYIFSSPRLPIREEYWGLASEDQENLIDAVSSLW